ncbi:uncharacterized protein LOC130774104 [Actinidia eriantha]|uniref:uncharacterized protein LOC130774104 n=1 Tax=Actinidia eriantha TaxID=165200 RepID=UPI00258EBE63|nr:uncharacterized protein LOC130774104 [Actinidia eriantha]XP_057488086.1 uncharacterized protein LOC130774104 [Actinidia eriantha]
MCPLRLILIFLSATLAGFFVLRNLKSWPEIREDRSEDSVNPASESPEKTDSVNRYSKVLGAIGTGFWTCVDMASGRYLWRNLVSSSSSSSSSSKSCD